MDITIQPAKLHGSVAAISSKSQAHRLLICSAIADGETILICPETNRDIEATAECLQALGADIRRMDGYYRIFPIQKVPETAVLNCCESGSTLRFMLPIAGALGVDALFKLEGRLPCRPLSPLWEEMQRMGCSLSRPTENTVRCQGKLHAGTYSIDGGVSSQFITGLLFALSLIEGESTLQITGKTESKPYIEMTRAAMALFDAPSYHTPGRVTVEGDWSNGAFFLAAQALGNNLTVTNLDPRSPQGDRVISELLPALEEHIHIDAADIPDLVPVLSVVAAGKKGAVFTNINRLRLKESDRVKAIIEMLESLGGKADASENSLIIYGTGLTGGTVNSHNDHRIAMAAAVAATICINPVTVLGADAVSKSYPAFWEEYRKLGGNYEQHLR